MRSIQDEFTEYDEVILGMYRRDLVTSIAGV